MAQWLRFQLNDGVVDGKHLVSAAALRETHTPQILIIGGEGGRGGAGDSIPATHFRTYGMGWMVEDYHGALSVQHGGNTPGMLKEARIASTSEPSRSHTSWPVARSVATAAKGCGRSAMSTPPR